MQNELALIDEGFHLRSTEEFMKELDEEAKKEPNVEKKNFNAAIKKGKKQ